MGTLLVLFLFVILLIFILPLTIVGRIISAVLGRKRAASYNPFSGNRRQREGAAQSPGRKKKVFSRTDGEYVDFEELPGEADATPEVSYKVEEQVSDADWVEVKD